MHEPTQHNPKAMNLSELHQQGGTVWMIPIDLGLAAVILVLLYLLILRMTGKPQPPAWLESLRQLGGLSLALGVFGTLAGFYQALGALEEIKEGLPFHIIAGGLKVALITVIYGCLVYILALIAYIVFKVSQRKAT